MDKINLLLILISFCTFLSLSFIASALEIAFFSLSTHTLRVYRKSDDPIKTQIASLLKRPRELFVTLFIINITVNILIQNVVSSYLGEDVSPIVSIGISFLLVVFAGEIFPKHLALRHTHWITHKGALWIARIKRWLHYPREAILLITVPIARVFFNLLPAETPFTREEVSHALEHSQKVGTLHPEERRLIEGFLNLQDMTVREVMRPREEILAYNTEDPLSTLIQLFCEEECSRVPVYTGRIDRVYGVIEARRFFIHQPEIDNAAHLLQFLTPPLFVPENTPIRKLLRQFDERAEQLALVVDEYGSVSGLIAREDLVEIVIGEIEDRRDLEELYMCPSRDVMIANGKLELTEFEEVFGVALESPNHMVTLGGWLVERLGEIPKSGTTYETPEFLFQVLYASPKRIHRVYVRRLHPSSWKGRGQ